MKKDADIASDEWFIPRDWTGCTHEEILKDKEFAVNESEKLFKKLLTLEKLIDEDEYKKLYIKFANLMLIAKVWYHLAKVHISYTGYFEDKCEEKEKAFRLCVSELRKVSEEGYAMLGERFYCRGGDLGNLDYIENFTGDVEKSFEFEKEKTAELEKENLTDFIVCAGGYEGHRLKKEVNFSDTFVLPDGIARIPGNRHGEKWSTVSSHGWFSYRVKVKPNSLNTIKITAKNPEGKVSMTVTLGNNTYNLKKDSALKEEFSLFYEETEGKDHIRIRIDRNSVYTPYIYTIKII